jgi:hypothetical protein
MPALASVPNVLKVVIEGTTPIDPWANTLHVSYSSAPPSAADCATFAGQVLASWVTNMSPLQYVAMTVEKAVVIDLSSSSGASGESVASSAGTRTGTRLPGSAAMLISKSIARRYRGGHPRSYVAAGVDADLLDASHWTTAMVVASLGGWEAFIAEIVPLTRGALVTVTEVIVSYYETIPPAHVSTRRVTPLVEPVTGYTAQPRLGTQRRRLGR